MADLVAAGRFLDLLETGGAFTFQTFPDSIAATDGARFPRVLHGNLEEHATELCRLNEAGAGIFVMVNEGDGIVRPGFKSCRNADNVIRVRAVFVDLDGAPIEPVIESDLAPDWVVQSSAGRWHAYWKVEHCPLEQFSAAQLALAQRFGGDRSVKDLPRVMRIPGFIHRKAAPFLSELYQPADYYQPPTNEDEQLT